MSNEKNKGNDPRQSMPVEQKAPTFGAVTFTKPDRVKASTKWGRTFCAAINAVVPIGHSLAVETTIWATREEKPDGITIGMEASFPKVLKAIGANADETRETFIAHVENAAMAWTGFQGARDAAVAALTGTKAKSAVNRPDMAVRLVKAPSSERPANQPTA